MSLPNSVEVVGDGGVDEMLLETMGEKYFSGRAETAVTEEQPKEPEKIEEPKIEEPKKEEAKEGEEGPQQDEEGEKKEADDAAEGDKASLSAHSLYFMPHFVPTNCLLLKYVKGQFSIQGGPSILKPGLGLLRFG